MLLAATHLQPIWTIAAAFLIAAWIVWYWIRLGSSAVPPSRRKIRRLSLALMLLSLPPFVRALSFLDPQTQKQEYVVTWSVAFVMALLVMSTAGLDALNTLRLMRRQSADELREAAADLTRAVQNRKSQQRIRSHHSRNGEAKS